MNKKYDTYLKILRPDMIAGLEKNPGLEKKNILGRGVLVFFGGFYWFVWVFFWVF
mgnify:CR=1 FL=1